MVCCCGQCSLCHEAREIKRIMTQTTTAVTVVTQQPVAMAPQIPMTAYPPQPECLFQYASATSARSRRKPFQLLLPRTRTTRYRESFFYRSALLWNSLPHDIQSLKNSKSFRDALENHYQSYKFTTTESFHIPLSSAFS